MKTLIVYLALLFAGTNAVLALNDSETASIDERLDAIQFSLNQIFVEASEQIESLTAEIRAVKQSLEHLSWYSEHVKQSVESIRSGNELLLRNISLLTSQSNEIAENQQYCANHEALKDLFFELKPKCGEFHPSPKPPGKVYDSCRYVPKSGVYRLAVNGSHDYNIKAYCEMDEFGGGWMVFQKRQDGSVDFNRTWIEYQNGFGSVSGEYWLGLQVLHELTTSNRYELMILMESFNGSQSYEQYSGIVIDSESLKYKLHLNSSGTGPAGDSLYPYRGEVFVTNDVPSGTYLDCARQLASGFWHYSCNPIDYRNNLNGVYGTTARKQGIWWNTFSQGLLYNPLKRVQMMIREKFN